MARSSALPQQIADLLGRYPLLVQAVGIAIGAAGFGLLKFVASANLAAQLSAALGGMAVILFAQFFSWLRRLEPQQRLALSTAGVACFGVCFLASLAAAAYHTIATPGGGAGSSGPGRPPQVAFDKKEPNKLVIAVTGKGWKSVAIEVQKIWMLTPDNRPTGDTVDWPHDPDIQLTADKPTPYTVKTLAGNATPIPVTLQPVLPDSSAEAVNLHAGGWVTRIKFAKPPKDCVFQLRLEAVNSQGASVNAGSVLYLPDLKTRYSTPTSDANQAVLRELSTLRMPKSPKLMDLLTAHMLGGKR
jgi:hypothetical protein